MPMFCRQCGTKLADGAAFCHSCGSHCEPPVADNKEYDWVAEARAAREQEAAIKEEIARLLKEYKESHDEALAARIRQLNLTLQKPTAEPKAKPPSSSKSLLTQNLGSDKTLTKVLLGSAVVICLFVMFAKVCSGPSEADKAHKEALEAAAVQAVKDNFDPNYDMLVLNPDTATGNWFAVENFGVYKCQGECFVVFYKVDVMPSGASEKKSMEFKWLYDTKRPLPVFANTEARTYFQPK